LQQAEIALATVVVPRKRLLPFGRALLQIGYDKPQRDYPRITAYTLEEALIAIISHEMWHLCCAQYRGNLGIRSDDPERIELTPEQLDEIGTWDLREVYVRRLSVGALDRGTGLRLLCA
jgi:hypothetical protein